jgi:hypothetical protein
MSWTGHGSPPTPSRSRLPQAGTSITRRHLSASVAVSKVDPFWDYPRPKWRWTRATSAGIVGFIFIIGGLLGLGWVANYWSTSQHCPTAPNVPGCVGPTPPLTTQNATIIDVYSEVSLGSFFVGILFVFIASYFPPEQRPRNSPSGEKTPVTSGPR